MGYYVMLDTPVTNPPKAWRDKPRFEHPTLDEARLEARRLVKKTNRRAVILEAIEAITDTDIKS